MTLLDVWRRTLVGGTGLPAAASPSVLAAPAVLIAALVASTSGFVAAWNRGSGWPVEQAYAPALGVPFVRYRRLDGDVVPGEPE